MKRLASDLTKYSYLRHPLPTEGFFHASTLAGLQNTNITHLTDLQHQALPHLLAGDSCLLLGPASTGKTLSYMLPILQNLY
jgi:superfamily II DNA/RNA helicase